MHLLSFFIFSTITNIIAFLAADFFIENFVIAKNFVDLLTAGALFALLSLFLRPALKLILGPLIFLTLGLGILAVNAILLALLDFFAESVTITGIEALLFGTLIVGAVNFISGLSARSLFRD